MIIKYFHFKLVYSQSVTYYPYQQLSDFFSSTGYLIMTKDWFKEFGFEVVVDKQYVPKEVLEILKTEPKVLPAWDPMGSLAL